MARAVAAAFGDHQPARDARALAGGRDARRSLLAAQLRKHDGACAERAFGARPGGRLVPRCQRRPGCARHLHLRRHALGLDVERRRACAQRGAMTAPSDRRFEGRLAAAVDGLDGRRVVRRDANRILVSKFEDGFAAALHASLTRVPELFDLGSVEAKYLTLAVAEPRLRRAETWHLAMQRLLADLGAARGLAAEQQAQVRAGVDSVAALLDSILWS